MCTWQIKSKWKPLPCESSGSSYMFVLYFGSKKPITQPPQTFANHLIAFYKLSFHDPNTRHATPSGFGPTMAFEQIINRPRWITSQPKSRSQEHRSSATALRPGHSQPGVDVDRSSLGCITSDVFCSRLPFDLF